jgi:toxin FitB
MTNILVDSNLLIYAANAPEGKVAQWLLATLPFVSIISKVETLGFHRFQQRDREALQDMLTALHVIYPTHQTFELAIELRQRHKMSLADALIAATTLEHGLSLATHNTQDFTWIENLSLFDPV